MWCCRSSLPLVFPAVTVQLPLALLIASLVLPYRYLGQCRICSRGSHNLHHVFLTHPGCFQGIPKGMVRDYTNQRRCGGFEQTWYLGDLSPGPVCLTIIWA